MGWEIFRIWSTDWFDSPERETDTLVKRLNELKKQLKPVETSFVLNPQQSTSNPESGVPNIDQARESDNVSRPILEPTESKPLIVPDASDAKVDRAENLPPQSTLLPFPGDPRADLLNFREKVVKLEVPEWTLQRSILRDAMIETFVAQQIDSPDDWFKKVPSYLRQASNPAEKKYLDQICAIIEGSATPGPGRKGRNTLNLN